VYNEKEIFSRSKLLFGQKTLDIIASKKVILFGVGGVGSWCAESLIRSGIKNLTIVDSDRVSITNINRQLVATTKTIGKVKVLVLKNRLLEINPQANIIAIQNVYSKETSKTFELNSFDYVIDAIDSLSNKMDLINTVCNETKATLFSSMGAALKLDPSKIKTAEFWKIAGCPLASALRRKFKKLGKPTRKFLCVYSDELLSNEGVGEFEENESEIQNISSKDNVDYTLKSTKVIANGTVAHVTAIFGFTLAGLVIQDIQKKIDE